MGCVSSKGDINDLHSNIFQVMNVDERYQLISAGQIEITDSELVLHQRRKAPTKWPLRSLRKYGFDSEIFTFECGRRCATGPGIYAFRCRKAEQLFNLLQQNIQIRNINEEANLNELSAAAPTVQRRHPPEGYLNPTNNPVRPTLSRPGSITSNGPMSPVSVSTPPIEHNNNKRSSIEHSYLNTAPIEEAAITYINFNAAETHPENSHLYMNVNTETVAKEIESEICGVVEEDPKHNYANIDSAQIDILPIMPSTNLDLIASISVPQTPTNIYEIDRDINYAELDLVPGKSGQAPPDSPNKIPKKSYVTIDFNKTNALSQSIHTRIDDSSRKTRHNSTIGDFRHSNSISD